MSMKKLLPIIFLFVGSAAFAQQDPLYAQYINNPMVLNPAYAGLNNNFNASISYRNQWAGFEGNPTTVNVNSHVSLVNNRVGAGLLIVQDKLGNTSNTELQAAFSYKLPLDKDRTLSFGMQTGFINFQNNYHKLNLADQNDAVFTQTENITKPNLGVGAILKSERFMIGASIPRLLSTSISVSTANTIQDYQLYNQHYYVFASYIYFLNEDIRLKPSTLIRAVKGSPLSFDLNFAANINEKYTAGIFTRNFNAYGIQLQAKFSEKFRFGYTFELPTNSSVGTQFTTHELFFGIVMPTFDYHDRSISNF